MRPATNMIHSARTIGLVAVVLFTPLRASAQDVVAPPPDRRFVQTIVDDLKSVASKENASLLSAAAAFALFAEPFDKNLTYSASSSTFLKTAFTPWARVVGEEWVLGGSAAASYLY